MPAPVATHAHTLWSCMRTCMPTRLPPYMPARMPHLSCMPTRVPHLMHAHILMHSPLAFPNTCPIACPNSCPIYHTCPTHITGMHTHAPWHAPSCPHITYIHACPLHDQTYAPSVILAYKQHTCDGACMHTQLPYSYSNQFSYSYCPLASALACQHAFCICHTCQHLSSHGRCQPPW